MNDKYLTGFCLMAILMIAFFIIRGQLRRASIAFVVWSLLLVTYFIGHKYFGLNTKSVQTIVVHVDNLSVKGDQMFYGVYMVNIEKNVPPMLFLRCKEEIMLRVYGSDYFLKIDDNI